MKVAANMADQITKRKESSLEGTTSKLQACINMIKGKGTMLLSWNRILKIFSALLYITNTPNSSVLPLLMLTLEVVSLFYTLLKKNIVPVGKFEQSCIGQTHEIYKKKSGFLKPFLIERWRHFWRHSCSWNNCLVRN